MSLSFQPRTAFLYFQSYCAGQVPCLNLWVELSEALETEPGSPASSRPHSRSALQGRCSRPSHSHNSKCLAFPRTLPFPEASRTRLGVKATNPTCSEGLLVPGAPRDVFLALSARVPSRGPPVPGCSSTGKSVSWLKVPLSMS